MSRPRIGKIHRIAAVAIAAVASLALAIVAVRALPGTPPHHECNSQFCALPPVSLP